MEINTTPNKIIVIPNMLKNERDSSKNNTEINITKIIDNALNENATVNSIVLITCCQINAYRTSIKTAQSKYKTNSFDKNKQVDAFFVKIVVEA